MNAEKTRGIRITDIPAEPGDFRNDVLRGLLKTPKELPTKYLYDARGSAIYERICTLDEYYPPRVEAGIMERHIREIVGLLGAGATLIEYGCGSCTKTRILLDNLPDLAAYIPIDISRGQLQSVSEELDEDYPTLEVLPVCADFTAPLDLPIPKHHSRRNVAYFPGSSIGNFSHYYARELLANIARTCGPGGALLIGVDLIKDEEILHRAYNDRQGVTAAFNLNLLERINRELGGDFDISRFDHRAFYNADAERVEMHLVSREDQTAHLDGVTIPFAAGESIWTESSHKYHPDGFSRLANDAGFTVERIWTDARQWFSVQYLICR